MLLKRTETREVRIYIPCGEVASRYVNEQNSLQPTIETRLEALNITRERNQHFAFMFCAPAEKIDGIFYWVCPELPCSEGDLWEETQRGYSYALPCVFAF